MHPARTDRRKAVEIHLPPQLEAALVAEARRRGTTAEALALEVLHGRFLPNATELEPRDEWERRLRQLATNCGVSLSDEALSRDEIYD